MDCGAMSEIRDRDSVVAYAGAPGGTSWRRTPRAVFLPSEGGQEGELGDK